MSKRLVQDVAAARHSGGVSPARATPSHEAVARPACDLSGPIWDALRERIGAERHAVWFGDTPQVETVATAGGAMVATLSIGDGRTQDWLRKMFKADVEAAVRQVCGADATVEWRPAPADTVEHAPQPAAPAPAPAGRCLALPDRRQALTEGGALTRLRQYLQSPTSVGLFSARLALARAVRDPAPVGR